MNIKNLNHIHFTGIKGVGMTALALCIRDLGIKVTGSDVSEEFITDETLKKNSIEWSVGFGEQNLNPKPDLVITTGAHGGFNNPEVLKAKELKIPVMSHAEALAAITEGKEVIAVCGVGGKTTTCAMIATILETAGLNPSYAIGVSDIPSLPAPGKYNKEGKYFVVEADEYAISPGIDNRPRFSLLSPKYLVVTNIEHDHPDIYPTFQDTLKAYGDLIQKVNNLIVWNADNQQKGEIPGLSDLQGPKQRSYGKDSKEATWRITNARGENGITTFNLLNQDNSSRDVEALHTITLHVPGIFNIYNSSAAFVTCKEIGIPEEDIIEGLSKYKGCKRRFEKIGEENGILFYDDYAHHPTEVYQTLLAARQWYPDRRIITLFQPHTYSRTKALFEEFSKAFVYADFVGIADIFASAREMKDESISSQMLVEAIKENHPQPENVGYSGTPGEAADYLASILKPGDVFITLGAGDVYKIHKILLEKLKNA